MSLSSLDLLRKACRRLIHVPYSAYALRRLRRSVRTSLFGRHFHVDPDVFHPTCFLSTRIFIEYLLRLPLQGKRLLDMGTGSGAVGIFASTAGADVVACDINPRAVALARRNAEAHGVIMDIRESDLFLNIGDERFDYICFNIPFYPKPATTPLELALNAGENFQTVERFARDARRHLRSDGRVVIIFSEDSGYESIMSIFREAGYEVDENVTRQKNFELFHIAAFRIQGIVSTGSTRKNPTCAESPTSSPPLPPATMTGAFRLSGTSSSRSLRMSNLSSMPCTIPIAA